MKSWRISFLMAIVSINAGIQAAPSDVPDAQCPNPARGDLTLYAVDPPLGDVLGGARVTLMGSGLSAVVAVTVGGAECGDLAVVDDRTVTCVTPPLPAGLWTVEVRSAGASDALPDAWEAWSPAQIPDARFYTASAGTDLANPLSRFWYWDLMASSGPWNPRDGAGLLWFGGRLWLLGGWGYPVPKWHDQGINNEVWSSPDLGATWTLELADDPAPPAAGAGARWSPRHTAGWLTYTYDGTNYMYVVGGDPSHPLGDVWRSADGVTWEEVAAHAPWEGRSLMMVGIYAGNLYVMGGQININDPTTALNDVWRSEDGGATWTRLPDAPWAPRGMTYNPVEYACRLWLVGGGTYDDAPRTYHNDVWSFDGSTWTEVLPDGVAPWAPREYHNEFAAGGELWISSGGNDAYPGYNFNDVWHTADGITWIGATGTPFKPGHADGVAVTGKGVVHASGNAMDTEVWRMTEVTGAPVAAWKDQGGAGADLAQADPAVRPLLVMDAFGEGADGLAFDGIDDWIRLAAPENQPSGRSVFWIGRTKKETTWIDYVNPAMTVVGDSWGSCRAQAGYSGDQIELVVTDASGAWTEGHVLRGVGQNDGKTRLIGFTQTADGLVTAYIDGVQEGETVALSYDAPFMDWDLVGAGFSFSNRAQVDLGVVMVVPGVISTDDIAKLAVFARKWTQAAPPHKKKWELSWRWMRLCPKETYKVVSE